MRIELDLAITTPVTLHARLHSDHGAIGLVGNSGAGKTTLLHMIAGLVPAQGRLVIDGVVVQDDARNINLPVHQRRIGYAFQDARLFPHLSVAHNLNFSHWIRPGSGRRAALEQLKSVSAALGLEHLLHRAPRHLSGGEKQRVALGRAMLSNPMILLLDEPLANVDAGQKAETLFYIEQLQKLRPVPMIYVSHDHREVSRMTQVSYNLDACGLSQFNIEG